MDASSRTPSSSTRNLAPLTMPATHTRRPSNSSAISSDSDDHSAIDSFAPLILVHDLDDSGTPFGFSDDEDDDDDSDPQSPQFEVLNASIPYLPPSLAFLYLLAPLLKLGAMLLPYAQLPLEYGLSALLAAAALAMLSRQIWFMLARYLRKAVLEDVILETFARGRAREMQRHIIRSTVRAGTGTIHVLLATTYLHVSVHLLLPLFPPNLASKITTPIISVTVGLVILVLSSAQSLASKSIVYTSWLSVLTYLLWLGCVIYAHVHGVLQPISGQLNGLFWHGITIIAFAFTSSSTISLFSSVKRSHQPVTTTKTAHHRTFRFLSTFSVAVATLLMLPSVIVSAFSSTPAADQPSAQINLVIASLEAMTLLLGIPAIIVVTPTLPIPDHLRHTVRFSISKLVIVALVVALSLLPSGITCLTADTLLYLTIASTFTLPSLLHIYTHVFKHPLSIIVPQIPGTPLTHTPTIGPSRLCTSPRPGSGIVTTTLSTVPDELLQRKERALQKRQMRKRIVWDVGVWVLLGMSGVAGVGAVGRLLGRW